VAISKITDQAFQNSIQRPDVSTKIIYWSANLHSRLHRKIWKSCASALSANVKLTDHPW